MLGTIEKCHIFDNGIGGVSVEEEAAPVVRDCTIHNNGCPDCYAGGLSFCERGQGTVENCDIHGCDISGNEWDGELSGSR